MTNKDNLSALIMAIGVVSLIVGFAVYFNNPELNKVVSSQGGGTSVPAIPAVSTAFELFHTLLTGMKNMQIRHSRNPCT